MAVLTAACSANRDGFHSILPDSVQLRPGDVVFRRGNAIVSRIVIAADRGSSYSHVGIVVDSSGVPMIVHAVPDEPDYEGDPDRVKMDRPERFFSSEYACRGEVCRCTDSTVARRAAEIAVGIYRSGMLFDDDYDDSDTTRMACTELVSYAYSRAGLTLTDAPRHRISLPMVSTNCHFPSDLLKSPHLYSTTIFINP